MTAPPPKACAIIVAGGQGARAALASNDSATRGLPKQLQKLGNKRVIDWSLEAFLADARFEQIVVVCPPDMVDVISGNGMPAHVSFAPSGSTRTASVRSGLASINRASSNYVFIHDAARPGLNQATLDALFIALTSGNKASAPALPVADALWHSGDGQLTNSQPRDGLLRVQTPQSFEADTILSAYAALAADEDCGDDVAVARRVGVSVAPIIGSERLDKITWPQDFARMSQILLPPLLPRMGTGFDAHRFGPGDHVTLCGVVITHTHGLAGHSDADVAWHALADAIYGGLCAGDIGHHFPPSQARWKGAPSSVFLKHAGDMVNASGGTINHVDITLVCEFPRIGPHREAMIEATASLLDLNHGQVSIKATTTEGMGFTGRKEGIAAQASATIMLPQDFTKASEVSPTL